MTIFKKWKRPVGVLVALSLLAGLLVAVPGSAQSTDPEPSYPASFEACPEDVIPGADFVDVPSRHDNAGDIDCIAYYGITKGTSATTYSPDAPVIREHMALFLVRLARLVGIDVPSAGNTPFTDISDLGRSSREAISQIYQLGITIGATATTYAPARNVNRGEMALFLQRLMDLMDPVADGRTAFGYTPDDVDRNNENFDILSPFRDLDNVTHSVNDAVTHLYELGVASGLSSRIYGPNTDMSRSAMAEFMAAILDHSNLRPQGVMVQVTPTQGREDFEITVMISVRSDTFAPSANRVVDWFYTDDPDGGLERNGTCDDNVILGQGDCVWDEDDDTTGRDDGNLFVDFDATPGATMTVYAWIGRRNGAVFDDDTVVFSKAQATSEKDADSLSVTHDVPVNAARVGGDGAYIVDLDRRSSVEFTIELRDENGVRLEREGVEIDVEVESRESSLRATRVDNEYKPDINLVLIGRDSTDDSVVTTDRRGRAVFELDGPSRRGRLDTVTIDSECCANERIEIAWSESDSVLVSAKPDFRLYQQKSGNKIEFTVEYDLYDQYGEPLRGTSDRYTGRTDTDLTANLDYQLYIALRPTGQDTEYDLAASSLAAVTDKAMTISRRSITADVDIEIPSGERTDRDFLVVVKPEIFSDADNDDVLDPGEIRYVASEEVVVWIVSDAKNENEFSTLKNRSLDKSAASPAITSALPEVELYAPDRKFRTFFTLWSYGSADRLQIAGDGDDVSIAKFEEEWRDRVNGMEDIDVLIYGSDFSYILIR